MLTMHDFKQLNHLVIYGAGGAAKDLIKQFSLANVQYNVVSTHGGEPFGGKQVVAFQELDKNTGYNIVIASQYFYEIYKQILQSDVEFENIYCFNVYTNEVVPVSVALRAHSKRTLYAVYDLEQNPASFDACVFANAAECYRIEKGFDDICFVVISPILKYGRLCDANFYKNGDERAFKERIDFLLMPIFTLIPSHSSTIHFSDRSDVEPFLVDKHRFPEQYKTDEPCDVHNPILMFNLPQPIGFFQAPERARGFVKDYFSEQDTRRLVTFTVREYLDEPYRNNDIVELSKFIDSLDLTIYRPVLVRDTENAGKPPLKGIEKYENYPMASLDIGVRMALYERAFMNFFCNNGTASLAAFSQSNYIIFKLKDESIRCTSTEFFKRRFGIDEANRQYLWANHKNQIINWAYDSCTNLKREFNQFLRENNFE